MLTQAARLKDKDKKKQEQGDGRPRTGGEWTRSHMAARSQASEHVNDQVNSIKPPQCHRALPKTSGFQQQQSRTCAKKLGSKT